MIQGGVPLSGEITVAGNLIGGTGPRYAAIRGFEWSHPLQGHRFLATYWRSMWKARCMAVAAGAEVLDGQPDAAPVEVHAPLR